MGTKNKHVVSQLGIWTVVMNESFSFVPDWLSSVAAQLWESARLLLALSGVPKASYKANDKADKSPLAHEVQTFAYLYTFVREVHSLGPLHFWVGIFMTFWGMVSGALSLYFSSRVLSLISQCLENHQLEPFYILQALAGRIVLSTLSEYLSKMGQNCSAILSERVKYHFLQKTMHTVLNFDVITAEDPEVRSKLGIGYSNLTWYTSDTWEAFDGLKETMSDLLTIISELSFLVAISQSSSTFTLSIVLCFVHPLLSLLKFNLYSNSFVAFCNNAPFTRLASLHSLVFDESFSQDRITNNLGSYIEKEFKDTKRKLGDVSTEHVYDQWTRKQPVYSEVLLDLSWDFSLIFFALRVLWDHSTVSLKELILVQQASRSVQGSSYSLFYNVKKISRYLVTIKNLYSLEKTKNKVVDGDLSYPQLSKEKVHTGAEVTFRNVSFKYPGTDKNALREVSFTIKPGQLVVFVGVNGSGKSSAVKLLTRLYDPSSGEILFDGQPLKSYKLADIRRAMAVLRQDHPVLPVSLRENVALGLPERHVTEDEIKEAIRQGGAETFVQKLKEGPQTVLDPVKTATTHFMGDTDAALKALVDEKEKKTDISGGETQRLSASRTFMRLMGGNIRLLVADEPTSALDPGGEHELFTRLRKHSGGKTVIFITHRFGHLTKYADLILCLKDGCLVEQGTHEALIAKGGEYKRLYDIQANAFASD